MKTFRMPLGGLLLAALALPLAAEPWEPIGPRGGSVFTLLRSADDPRIVFAGTNFGGLYRSDDAGLSWTHVTTAFSNKVVFTLAADPKDPTVLFAGTFEAGAYRSTDRGLTWNAVDAGLPDPSVGAIAVSPHDDTVLLGGSTGAFRSVDGGLTWAPAGPGLPPEQINRILWDREAPGVAYAGTLSAGVRRTLDGGETWAPWDTGIEGRNVTDLSADPESPGRLWACASDGVFTRTRQDTTWQDVSFELTDVGCSQIRPEAGGDAVFAATAQGTWRLPSPTAGSWELAAAIDTRLVLQDADVPVVHLAGSASSLLITENFVDFFPGDTGMQNRFAGTLATVGIGPETVLYAGTDYGVEFTSQFFVQPDGTLPWLPGLEFEGAIFSITPHPERIQTLFIGTERSGVWRTDDFGTTWAQRSEGIVPEQVFDLSGSPTGAQPIYAGTSSGLFISRDGGSTWRPDRNTSIPFPVAAVEADPERPGTAFYGTFDGRVFRTFDERRFSQSWRHPDGAGIRSIVASRFFNIYLVTETGELFASDDVGGTFNRRGEETIAEPVLSVAVDPERPWVVYAGTLFGGVYKSESNAIEWTQVNDGLDVPIVGALAIDPSAPGTVYAGAVGTVFRSTDGGGTWTGSGAGLPPDGLVGNLLVDRTDPTQLLAKVQGEGLFRSTDSGTTWTRVQAGGAFAGETSLAQDRTEAGRILAGTQLSGVLASTDGGASFEPSSTGMTLFVRSVDIDPSAPDTMYAASLSAGVFRSDDGGASWRPSGLSDRNLFDLTIDPGNSDVLYAGTSLGISRSEDGGSSWTPIGDRTGWAFDVVVDPNDPLTLYAGSIGGYVYVTRDGGEFWVALGDPLPNLNVVAVALDPVRDVVFAAVEDEGLYRYALPSGPWERLPDPGGVPPRPLDLLVAPGSGDLFVATNGAGLFRSADGGLSWAPAQEGLPGPIVAGLAAPAPGHLAAALLGDPDGISGVYLSRDGGATWSPSGEPDTSVRGVFASPAAPDRLYAVTSTGLRRSDDGGASWSAIGAGLEAVTVTGVFEDPVDPQRLLATAAADGLFESLDGGGSFSPVAGAPPGNWRGVVAAGGALFAANLGTGLLKSEDGGTTWIHRLESGLQDVPVLGILVDPSDSARIFAATGGLGLLRSEDRGATWTPVLDQAPFFLAAVIDPSNPQRVYAGSTTDGVFVSEDGGDTWRPFNDGLFNPTVTALAIDPVDPDVIYVGTEGGGVFRRRVTAPGS